MPEEKSVEREACVFCLLPKATDADYDRNAELNDEQAVAAGLDDLCWEEEGEACLARLAESERPSSLQEALERIDDAEGDYARLQARLEEMKGFRDACERQFQAAVEREGQQIDRALQAEARLEEVEGQRDEAQLGRALGSDAEYWLDCFNAQLQRANEAVDGCKRLTREREEARQGEDEFKAQHEAFKERLTGPGLTALAKLLYRNEMSRAPGPRQLKPKWEDADAYTVEEFEGEAADLLRAALAAAQQDSERGEG